MFAAILAFLRGQAVAAPATIPAARMAMASDIVTRRAAPLWIGPRMYRSA